MMLTEKLEGLLETGDDERRHPEVERTGDEARRIARLGEVVTQAAINEVGHALSRSRLPHIALLPCGPLQLFLEMHDRK